MSEQIKVSDIRAKFPMYEDMTDEQLIGAVRRKFYADIPMNKFVQKIDFDTERERLSPVNDMSGWERTKAGAGKAVSDLGRGAGQWLGLVSREDVADSRKLDKSLMGTTAGKWGNIGGNVLATLPSAFIPGANTYTGAAAIGALTGALAPSESTGETVKNIGLGGAIGPTSVAGGRAIGAGIGALKGLVEPLTKAGQERIAARTLQAFAQDPKMASKALQGAAEIVPGSIPTMAQGSGDAGLAQLERTLSNNPEIGPELAARYANQRAARLGAISSVAGDATKREAAVSAREAATKPLYQQATGAVYQVDKQLGDLLNRPVMQQAISRAERLANNEGRSGVTFSTQSGAPFAGVGGAGAKTTNQVTGQGLQDIKMSLDDMLSDPLAGIGKNEAGAVKSIRGKLVDWMEVANPVYKSARETFSKESVPINDMDVAQSLLDKMQPALARYGATTRETANSYASALEAAKDSVKKQVGINRPMSSLVSPEAQSTFDNVARDMARKTVAEEAGRAVGSNTAQNLASQNLLGRILGPAGLPDSWAQSTALQTFLSPLSAAYRVGGAENAILNRLGHAAMDPKDAARLLQLLEQQGLIEKTSKAAIPYVTPGVLSTALLGQSQQ